MAKEGVSVTFYIILIHHLSHFNQHTIKDYCSIYSLGVSFNTINCFVQVKTSFSFLLLLKINMICIKTKHYLKFEQITE